MTTSFKSMQLFVWAVFLMGSALAQSSLPLTAGKVLVDRIDLASNKKIRLPEGRWVVMGLHKAETPLTGGSRTSQTVEHVSLMNENENAPVQYLTMSWTLFADVNWTSQPCDSTETIKNRPLKDTHGTNTSSLIVKCSASEFTKDFGGFLSKSFDFETPIRKALWLTIGQHARPKPVNAVDLYGYISKNRSDFISWYFYINPKMYGLDQASDTQFSKPIGSRQNTANNLLKYVMEWNKQYLQEVEKEFFPRLFQSASGSVNSFNFSERAAPMTLVASSLTPPTSNIQPSTGKIQKDNVLNITNRLPVCQGSEASIWSSCIGSFTSPNGHRYVGEFKDGKLNGHGAVTFASGYKYVGEFKDGKFDGQGTATFASGFKYVGEWKDDLRNGQGIRYNADGVVISSGNWSRDWLVNSFFLDTNRFPFNPPTQLTESNSLSTTERDRLIAEVEVERKRRQEHEQQEASIKERDRIMAELDAERKKRQELETQLVIQQQPSQGIRRNAHALVIGNGAYPGSGRLDNPVNDANAISQKLRSMGFTVTTVTDANRQKLVQSMAQFRRTAAAADISLLFYAGHGVQIFGTNYILPTDVDQTDPAQATIQGVSLNSVVENFLPGKTKLVFLDACRDNALQRTNDRSVSKGLAPISAAQGTLISYATKDGQTAADGVGSKNSPFTQALLEHINDPQDIAVVLRKVRERVMNITGGKQQPWEYGSLTGGELVLSAIRPK